MEDSDKCLDWIAEKAKPITDADPMKFAVYVMALLKQHKPVDEQKDQYVKHLNVFLKDDTEVFVDKLIEYITNKNRKRKCDDSREDTMKSSKRNKRISSSRDDNLEKEDKDENSQTVSPDRCKKEISDDKYSRHKSRDEKESKEYRAPLCKNYEEQGLCIRGDKCPYVHKNKPLVINKNTYNSVPLYTPYSPSMHNSNSNRRTVIPGPISNQANVEAYNPEIPSLRHGNQIKTVYNNPNLIQITSNQTNNYVRKGVRSRLGNNKCKTIILRRIPEGINKIMILTDHFAKFGEIETLTVHHDDDKCAASITFVSPDSAYSVYKCSEPILNNRFIKLYLDIDNNSKQSQPKNFESNSKPYKANVVEPTKKISPNFNHSNKQVHFSSALPHTSFHKRQKQSIYVPRHKLKIDNLKTMRENKIKVHIESLKSLKLKSEQMKDSYMQSVRDSQCSKDAYNTNIKLITEKIHQLDARIMHCENQLSRPMDKAFIAKRAILDAQLDEICYDINTECPQDMKKAVVDLKKKALAMGVFSTTAKMTPLNKFIGQNLVVDNRTKIIEVIDFPQENFDDAIIYFNGFPEIEKCSIVSDKLRISFKTQNMAKKWAQSGVRFKGITYKSKNSLVAKDYKQLAVHFNMPFDKIKFANSNNPSPIENVSIEVKTERTERDSIDDVTDILLEDSDVPNISIEDFEIHEIK